MKAFGKLKLVTTLASPPPCKGARQFNGVLIESTWLTFSDDLISNALRFRGGYFQPGQVDYIARHVTRTKPNFFDLGTNIGTESVPISKYIKPLGGRVLGIEANPRTATLGVANLELNDADNAVIINRAITADRRQVPNITLSFSPKNRGDTRVGAWQGLAAERFVVETVTVDQLFALDEDFFCKVNVWKLDIQGSEGLAFLGAGAWLARCPPCYITTELFPLWLKQFGTPLPGMVAHLRGFGYQIYHDGEVYMKDGSEYGEKGFSDFQIIHSSCSAP